MNINLLILFGVMLGLVFGFPAYLWAELPPSSTDSNSAAWMQVIVTSIGTAALIVTLYYTRRAVNTADAAVKVTQRIGEAQTRAYISVVKASFQIRPHNNCPQIIFHVHNSGNSPVRQLQIGFRAAYCVNGVYRIQPDFSPTGRSEHHFGYDIAAGDTKKISHMQTNFPMGEADIAVIGENNIITFESIVRFEFIDVFDKLISEEQTWSASLQGIGDPLPFFRTPFAGFALIEQGRPENA